jgi:hypothetical protein
VSTMFARLDQLQCRQLWLARRTYFMHAVLDDLLHMHIKDLHYGVPEIVRFGCSISGARKVVEPQ